MKHSIGAISLGCPKNLIDTEIMLGILSRVGYEIVGEKEAEILIINTCAFIEDACRESLETIREMVEYKKKESSRKIIVTGCLVQRYSRDLLQKIPEIDALVGTGKYQRISSVVSNIQNGKKRLVEIGAPSYSPRKRYPRLLTTPPYTAYLKIAEGCDNRCAYCIIHQLRGPFRSRTKKSVLEEAQNLTERGVKELILVAQDTTRYGEDLYQRPQLAKLLSEIARVEKNRWLRFLYAYPDSTRFTPDLMEIIAREPKICKYIDLPIQHISDPVLQAMHRRSNSTEIRNLISRLRKNIPGLNLRSTLMVGFPGETKDDFHRLCNFVGEIKFDRLGVFIYSQEKGTLAAKRNKQIPLEIKQERYHCLMELQAKISLENNRHKIGKILEVLVEGKPYQKGFHWIGRSRYDAPEIDGLVYVRERKNSRIKIVPGDIIKVRITEAEIYDLIGERIDDGKNQG